MSLRRKNTRLSPIDTARKYCQEGLDPPKFKKTWINEEIGFGLFTTSPFNIGDFLLEYSGSLKLASEADVVNMDYTYLFQYKGKDYVVDAADSKQYGRFINDGIKKDANCKMKTICTKDGVPHLCLFATKIIQKGTELRYDYGVRDLPWRIKRKKLEPSLQTTYSPNIMSDSEPVISSIGASTTDSEPVISSIGASTTDSEPVMSSISASTTDSEPVMSSISASTTECEPVMSSISASTTDSEPVMSSISATTIDCEPVMSSINASTTDSEPVMSSISATTIEREPVMSSINASTTDSEPLMSSISATTTDSAQVMSSINASTTDSAPVMSSISASTTDSEPVMSSINASTTDSEPVMSSISATTIDPEPVMSSISATTIDREPVISSISATTIERELVMSSINASTTDSEPLMSSISATTTDSAQVMSSINASTTDSAPVMSSISASTTDSEPVMSSINASTTDSEPVMSSISATTIDPEPVMSSISATTIDREPVISSISATTIERELVMSSINASTTDSEPVMSSINASTTDSEPVMSSISATTIDPEPVMSSISATTIDREPVISSISATTIERELVMSSINASTTNSEPLMSSISATTTDSAPVMSSFSASTTDSAPVMSCLSASTTDSAPVMSSISASTTDSEPVMSSISASTIGSEPVMSSVNASTIGSEPVTSSVSLSSLPNIFSAFIPAVSFDVPTVSPVYVSLPTVSTADKTSDRSKASLVDDCVEDSAEDSDCSDTWPLLSSAEEKYVMKKHEVDINGDNTYFPSSDDDDTCKDPSYFPSSDQESESEQTATYGIESVSSKPSNATASKENKMPDDSCSGTSEERKVSIQLSQKKEGCRIYDKRQACFYCGGLFAKISDHLTNKHSSELEVSRIVAKKKGSSERKTLWYRLRNKGNFHHNLKVLNQNKGSLIVNRRPTVGKEKTMYTPCPQCFGFFLKEDLWRHIQMCPVSVVSTSAPDCSKSVKYSSSLLLKSITYSGPDEEFMKHVISGMKNDKVLDIIKNDSSLLLFGSNMLQKVGTGRIANVRQKIRELARLLEELRAEHVNLSSALFTDFLKPSCFDDITKAVNNLCRRSDSNEKTERGCLKFDKPSLALKLGHSLKKLAEIKRGQALRKNDDFSRKEAEDYILLHISEWAEKVSAHAFQTLSERKFNEPDVLPLTEDIVKLRSYLLTKMKELMVQLEKSVDVTTWRTLALMTLCRVTVFNKRRGGETGQILLKTYSNRRTDCDSNSEIFTSLAPIEKQLIQKLQLIEITGKRNRKVPVLLTADMTEAIDCLINFRDAVGVPAGNKYLFAAPTTENGYLKGWDALSMACRNCEMKKPELMKTTNLRKYVATVSQIVDLGSENELEWLANHMGHTISVHRNFYRLQEHTIELAKVSKLLIAVDRGECSKYAGKKLDDITLDELPAVSLDADNDADDGVNRNVSLDDLVDLDEGVCSKQGTVTEVDDDGVQNERIDEDFLASDYSSSDEDAEITQKKTKKRKTVDSDEGTSSLKKKMCRTSVVSDNGRKTVQRNPWCDEETELLRKYFHWNIVKRSPPSKGDIMLQGRKNEKIKNIIETRGWKKVKYYVWSLAQQHDKKRNKLLN